MEPKQLSDKISSLESTSMKANAGLAMIILHKTSSLTLGGVDSKKSPNQNLQSYLTWYCKFLKHFIKVFFPSRYHCYFLFVTRGRYFQKLKYTF